MFRPSKRPLITKVLLFGLLMILTVTASAQQGGSKPPAGGGDKVDNSTQSGVVRQWASSAEASSEYPGWEAEGATGAPDITECGDFRGAWASEKWDDGVEWWLGYYDTPVIPTQINVHQNYNPGTIVSLVMFEVGSDEPIILENSADSNARNCPHVFTYDVTGVDVLVDRVGLFVDQSANRSWTEVDAVELVGLAEGASGGPGGGGPGGGGPSGGGPGGGGPSGGGSSTTRPTEAFGVGITCPDGQTFSNGVEVVVNMRPGFTYTATAIGVGDFDPIVAVTDGATTLCNDDDSAVRGHTASLPSSGEVGPSSLSSQMVFTYNGNEAFKDISFVVGSFNNAAGSFVLTIEGLAVTGNDGIGDPFALRLTENVIFSGMDVSAYMVSVTDSLDSQLYVVDSDNNIIVFSDGTRAACDDAGTSSCYGGDDTSMRGYFVTRRNGNALGGGQYDSYMRFDASNSTPDTYINFRFSSSEQRTRGDYVAAFHVGTTASPE